MSPDKLPNWLVFAIFLAVVILSGWLSEQDYQDQRADECYRQGKDYNAEADLCVKRNK
jgi:hypothetical protein